MRVPGLLIGRKPERLELVFAASGMFLVWGHLKKQVSLPFEYRCIRELEMSSNVRILRFVATTLLLAVFPAAHAAQKQKRQSLGTGEPSTERMTREVRHELLLLPYYSVFDNLAYKVEDTKVILMGQVTNPVLKSDAEAAVKNIEGVESVENRIEVLPPSPSDDRIRLAEYRAIYGFDGLSRYALGSRPSIHIIVDHGRVTLVGVIDSEADKNMAGIQANSVPGVFGVTNNLVVANSGAPKPSQNLPSGR